MFCIKIYDLSNNSKRNLALGVYTPKQTTLLMKQTVQSSFEGEQQDKTIKCKIVFYFAYFKKYLVL